MVKEGEFMYFIKEMPKNERPRERFIKHGREALSNHELIAIILRTGSKTQSVLDLAQKIYYNYASIKALNQADVMSLTKLPGVGPTKAIQLLSALELGRRLYQEEFIERTELTSPKSVFDYMAQDVDMLDQEHFFVLYLDTKGRLIKKTLLFKGSLNASLVHPREVFKHAVTLSAASLIMVHNHPSGDPTPSQSDIKITDMMIKNGKLMDIEVIDHIILGKGRYYSLRENNHFGHFR